MQQPVTKAGDVRFTSGILNLADSARFLGVPRQTFHRWARGYERGAPLIHVLPPGARVADVAAMLKAGEEANAVAEEFGISVADVRTAARVVLGRAA